MIDALPRRRREVAPANLSWLVQLRWGAIAGQLAAIAVVILWMGVALPWPWLLLVIGAEAASNALLARWARTTRSTESWSVGMVLVFDVVLFTILLLLTGGSYNPFSFLYLVYITLAAVVLSPGWSWTLAVFSLTCFWVLFLLDPAADHGPHAGHLQSHLEGMWFAFAVAAAFIVYFVQRVRGVLAAREAELARARDLTARHEKLSSLATLAAGAAHQLATPLSTIAVISKELERELARGGTENGAIDDVQTIREQVERCRTILSQMATDAGQSKGEALRSAGAQELIDAVLDGLEGAERVDVGIGAAVSERRLRVPFRSVVQCMRAVIKNALEASAVVDGRVAVTIGLDGDWRFDVRDAGPGIAADVLDRVGEPFFTTKGPDRGMGLGVFLARALVERLGGRFAMESEPGRGTVVSMWIPEQPATNGRAVSNRERASA